MKTLIVGCSFMTVLYKEYENNPDVIVAGSPGSGNQSIAATALHELAKQSYDKVIILWSGINRLDAPISKHLHNTFPRYPWTKQLDDIVWYHSGGIAASYEIHPAPSTVKNIFHTQYVAASRRYLTDLSLISIIGVQSFLEANNIPYKMSFIYDIHNKEFDNNWLNNVFGTIDTTSRLFKMVKWEKFAQTTPPYEWAKANNLLQEDQVHPTQEGMVKWLDLIG